MSRTTIDIDASAVAAVMSRYGLPSERAAVDFALRTVLGAAPMSLDEALRMEGTGWEGDLGAFRGR